MNLKNIIRIAENESSNQDNWNLKNIIKIIVRKFNYQNEEKSFTIKDIADDMKNDINEYIQKQSHTEIKKKTIEYYISKRSYSPSKYNFDRAYKDVCKDIQQGNLNLDELAKQDIRYTYNIDEDFKMLVAGMLGKIREDKNKVVDFINKHEVFEGYRMLTNKSKEKILKNISMNNKDTYDVYKKLMVYVDKSEKEILEDEFKTYTKNASDELKKECIESITNDVRFLDKYGFIDNYIEGNNVFNRRVYLFDCDYTYEETMDLLSEKNLKKLSAEQLIGLAAFWNNRTAKTINEINKATYALSHPELYETKKSKDGRINIKISDETLKNIHLKMNILQKISFEIFDEAELIKDDDSVEDTNNDPIEIDYEVEDVCEKYEKEYKNYLDKKLEFSKNDLKNDVIEALVYENSIYNLYTTKGSHIQALLISILNSGVDNAYNYGYIDEKERGIKNFIIVGVDIPGMNMPLRLHTRESSVLDVLKSAQNGNIEFPKYKGSDDFIYKGDNVIMPTHIYLPMSKEKTKKLKEAAKTINEKDKYGNTIRHLEYIATNGKMPTHMLKEKETSVELKNNEEENEK